MMATTTAVCHAGAISRLCGAASSVGGCEGRGVPETGSALDVTGGPETELPPGVAKGSFIEVMVLVCPSGHLIMKGLEWHKEFL
jgi:hypothetical protein